jgi:hypothetical protein
MLAGASISRRIHDQDLGPSDTSAEVDNTTDEHDRSQYHASIARARSVVNVSQGDSAQEKDDEQYNEHEDRLFIFPPPKFRKQDRQLRVLMSR